MIATNGETHREHLGLSTVSSDHELLSPPEISSDFWLRLLDESAMNSLLRITAQSLHYTVLISISKHDVVKEPLRAWQTEIHKTEHEKSHKIETQENQCQLSEK